MTRYVIIAVHLIASVLVSGTVIAKDIGEGSIEISGDTSFKSESNDLTGKVNGTKVFEADQDSQELTLVALYYVAPNVGVGLLWNNESSESDDGIDKEEETFNMMGLVGGYNISLDPGSSIRVFGALIFAADFESKLNGVTDTDADGDGFMIGAQFKKFLNDNVSINFGISSASVELDDSGGTLEVDTTSFDVGFSIHI